MARAQREPITGVWMQSGPHPTPPPVKTRRICINFSSDLWQKWGGHVHPSPPRGDAPGERNGPCAEKQPVGEAEKSWRGGISEWQAGGECVRVKTGDCRANEQGLLAR